MTHVFYLFNTTVNVTLITSNGHFKLCILIKIKTEKIKR